MIKKYKFTILTTIVILILLLMPTDGVSDDKSFLSMIPHLDKLVHCCMFGFLSLVYEFEKKIDKKSILNNIITLVCFALLTEILQKLTGYRSFDVMDILADTIGITIGTIIMPFILKKFKR